MKNFVRLGLKLPSQSISLVFYYNKLVTYFMDSYSERNFLVLYDN